MKFSELKEARLAGQNKDWWVIKDSTDADIIGLFDSREAAIKYRNTLLDDFGEVVTFNMEVHQLKTLDEYYNEVQEHYNWLQQDE